MAVVTAGTTEAGPPGLWPAELPYADADYGDAFTALTSDASERSPEQWARQILEGASAPMRLFLRFGWRYALGFRLVRTNAVLGWPVIAQASDWVALEQQSWLFAVVLLMRKTDDELTWATRVEYRSPVSKAAWAIVGMIHRRYAPRALRRAANSSERQLPPVVDTDPPELVDPVVSELPLEPVFVDVSEDGGSSDEPVDV